MRNLQVMMDFKQNNWAVILGGSGGFGLATAKLLAKKGFNLILVYRERKKSLEALNVEIDLLKEQCDVIQFNLNANDIEKQEAIIAGLLNNSDVKNKISVLLHSIADGNLRPTFSNKEDNSNALQLEDFEHTIKSMGTSLFRWTQLLFENKLFASNASVIGLTSEGSMHFLRDYAAVSASKAVMESNIRYIAVELAKYGIRANLINAGITDSNALKVFPDYEALIQKAKDRNPSGRLTTADDVAKVIAFLASDDAKWINGSILTVDGGEQLIGLI